MASLLEQLEAGDAADDEERAADARFARMLQRMKEGGDGAEREASLQSEIDALSAAEASVEATKIRLRRFCSTALGTSVFADPEELVSRAVTDVAHLRGACVAEKGQYELAEATARLSESTERNRELEERLAAAEAALRREEQARGRARQASCYQHGPGVDGAFHPFRAGTAEPQDGRAGGLEGGVEGRGFNSFIHRCRGVRGRISARRHGDNGGATIRRRAG